MTEASFVRLLICAVLDELTLEEFARLKAQRQAASLQQDSHQE